MRGLMVRCGLILLLIFGVSLLVGATDKTIGKTRKVTLVEPVVAGSVQLKAGAYKVSHVVDGDQHIMVFVGSDRDNQGEFRVKCHMKDLPGKALYDEQRVASGANGQKKLLSLTFQGDKVEHVF